MKTCRLDGGDLLPLWDLGKPKVSDFVAQPGEGTPFPLRLAIGRSSGLVQLQDTFDPEQMYRHYYYRSGLNPAMRRALAEVGRAAEEWVLLAPGDVVVDVGANDGTLLSCWPAGLRRVGFEPATTFAEDHAPEAEVWIPEFFRADLYPERSQAKVVTSVAMFYDLEDPRLFAQDVAQILHPEGVWVCQMSYLPLMLATHAWDNICAEHLCYYSLETFDAVLAHTGLEIVDVELNAVNGGSFRIFIRHAGARSPVYQQELGRGRVAMLARWEEGFDLFVPKVYDMFREDCLREGALLVKFLQECRSRRKTVVGYGASTKSNTLLQTLGITPDLLPMIADRSEAKWGRFMVGSKIPIISEDEMRRMKPDYLLALPWHFIQGFLRREEDLRREGTRFVVPLPYFEVLE